MSVYNFRPRGKRVNNNGGCGGGEQDLLEAAAQENVPEKLRSPFTSEALLRMTKERWIKRRKVVEKRRLEDLHLIKEMNRISNDDDEGDDPLCIFPKEVWELVVAAVQCPQNLVNLSHVNTLFQDIIEPIRIRDILFPQILKVDAFLAKERKSPDFDFRLEPFLSLRSVSGSLRKAVDSLMETEQEKILRNRGHGDYNDYALCVKMPTYRLEGKENELLEMEEILRIPKPLFPLKSVRVDINEVQRTGGGFSLFEEKMTSVFAKIGNQILYFHCFILVENEVEIGAPVKFSQSCFLFRKWISFMPNLKWLFIGLGVDGEQRIAEKGYADVQSLVPNYTYPRLRHLEEIIFETETAFEDGFDLFEALVIPNIHVQTITLTTSDPDVLEEMPRDVIQHMNLTGFAANCSGGYFPMNIIQEIVSSDWGLTRLHINVDIEGESMNGLFRFLEHFQNLKFLSVQVSGARIGNEGIRFLELPNLLEFQLVTRNSNVEFGVNDSSIQFFFSLQFLLHLGELKKIVMQDKGYNLYIVELKELLRSLNYTGMVDFLRPRKSLMTSNIWSVFPNLEYVKIPGYLKTKTECRKPK